MRTVEHGFLTGAASDAPTPGPGPTPTIRRSATAPGATPHPVASSSSGATRSSVMVQTARYSSCWAISRTHTSCGSADAEPRA
jgi:hypothetical protein